jgi:hypothetical protein
VQPTIPRVVQHNPGQLPQATLPGTCQNVLYETTPEISWLQNLKCLAKEGNIRHMGHRMAIGIRWMNIINICSPEVYGDAQLPHARTHKHVHSFHRMAFLESLTINDFRHPLVHLQPPKLRCKCKSTKFLRVYIDMFSFWVGLFLVINHPISLIFHQITIYIYLSTTIYLILYPSWACAVIFPDPFQPVSWAK